MDTKVILDAAIHGHETNAEAEAEGRWSDLITALEDANNILQGMRKDKATREPLGYASFLEAWEAIECCATAGAIAAAYNGTL